MSAPSPGPAPAPRQTLALRLQSRLGMAATPPALKRLSDGLARMGLSDEDALTAQLPTLAPGHARWNELIDHLVVPETWFRREPAAFDALRELLAAPAPGQRIRLLSMPCATGEEAISLALALRDQGWSDSQFEILGVDLSARNLAAARSASYRGHAFRGCDPMWVQRHFQPCDEPGRAVRRQLRQPLPAASLSWLQANALDLPASLALQPFDAVFCRNLLIYLDDNGREALLRKLQALCRPESGLIFLGHSEATLLSPRLQRVDKPQCFGFYNQSRRAFTTSGLLPLSSPEQRPAPSSARRNAASGGRLLPPPPAPQPAVKPSLQQALMLADRGQLAEALGQALALAASTPLDADVQTICGKLQIAMGQPESGMKALERALYIEPRHGRALAAMQALCMDRGDQVRAAHWRSRLQRVRNAEPIGARMGAPE